MNSTELISLLQESDLFKKVKSSLLASLVMNATQMRLAAEQILITSEQQNDCIYIILSGRLKALIHPHDPKPLALFGIGECVGEMSMFNDHHASAYIAAVTDCELLSVPHSDAWAVLNESLQASHNMLNILAHRMRSSNEVLAEKMEYLLGYETLDYVDTVTGIYNRRWLSENTSRLIHRYTVNHQPCAFILLKIDNFAQYAAKFGALGSDQAQRTVARAMLFCLRPNDVSAHIGDDQFAIFLPLTEHENINRVIGRLLERIEQTAIAIPSGDALPPITVQVGIVHPQPGDTLDSLVAHAHAALGSTPGA
jgi:diguanylate cyclase (GGDEF)-like protein